eukprot:3931539-Rhodomonas_salina.3
MAGPDAACCCSQLRPRANRWRIGRGQDPTPRRRAHARGASADSTWTTLRRCTRSSGMMMMMMMMVMMTLVMVMAMMVMMVMVVVIWEWCCGCCTTVPRALSGLTGYGPTRAKSTDWLWSYARQNCASTRAPDEEERSPYAPLSLARRTPLAMPRTDTRLFYAVHSRSAVLTWTAAHRLCIHRSLASLPDLPLCAAARPARPPSPTSFSRTGRTRHMSISAGTAQHPSIVSGTTAREPLSSLSVATMRRSRACPGAVFGAQA